MNNKLFVIFCVLSPIAQKYAGAYRQLSSRPSSIGSSSRFASSNSFRPDSLSTLTGSSLGGSWSSYKPSYKRINLQLDHVNVPPYSPSYGGSSTLHKPSLYYGNSRVLPTFGSTSNVDMSHMNDLILKINNNNELLKRSYETDHNYADSKPYRLYTIPGNFSGDVVPTYRLPKNVDFSGLNDLLLNSRLRPNVSQGSNKDISHINNITFNSFVTPPTRSYDSYKNYTTTTEKTQVLLKDKSVNETVIKSVRENLKRNSGKIRRQYTITADAYKNSKNKILKMIDYDSKRTCYIVHPKQQGQLKFHPA